jgi:Uri superfamily endonuclease
MGMELPKAPGTYVLILRLSAARRLVVGRLGEILFAPGFYAYVGSALGRTGSGLRQRLTRHLRRGKRLHWHIDTLRESCEVVEIWYAVGDERRECAWAVALGALPGITATAAAFGASDCACRTHLFVSAELPDADAFGRAVRQRVTRLVL